MRVLFRSVAARLRQAGAVLPGKLVTTEAATFEHHASFRRPKKSLGSGSLDRRVVQRGGGRGGGRAVSWRNRHRHRWINPYAGGGQWLVRHHAHLGTDRKSTRLNSSH